jgi:peptide/nickel transport system substrate-binding protein
VCLLCTKLPTLENGLAQLEKTPNGKLGIAITYSILPEAVWGDGVPITTEDVIFTWKIGRHRESGVAGMEFYRSLYKIDIKDPKTFTLHFDKRTFDYNAINGFLLVPKHLDEASFTTPREYKNKTKFDTDPENTGLYFGPYIITQAKPGSHVILEQNSNWWGKKPYFKRIVIRVIGNTAALEANLLSGTIDMIAGELGLTVDQAVAFERRHGKQFNISYKAGLIYEHIDLNLDNPFLKDKRVRKALLYALDRDLIVKQLFGGRQPVAHTSVSPLDWILDKNAPTYKYDPNKAMQLLTEAGWKKRGRRLLNAKGETLSFEIMTTAGNRSRELVEQVLQSQWKKLGIDVQIKNQPARIFFGQTVTQRKFKAMAMFAWISSPESVPRTTLHSNHIPNKENNFSGQNYTGYKNPEMDRLLEKIEIELDRTKRQKLWYRFQTIYANDLPVIPLYFRAEPYILPKWLKGLEPTGHQDPSSLWVENWYRN